MNEDRRHNKVKNSVRSNSEKVEKFLLAAGKSLLETTTGVTVGRVVDAGVKAIEARREAKANEAYMKKMYGTEEAATKTRRARNPEVEIPKAKPKKRTARPDNLKQGYLLK